MLPIAWPPPAAGRASSTGKRARSHVPYWPGRGRDTCDSRESVTQRGNEQGKSESCLSIVSRAVTWKGEQCALSYSWRGRIRGQELATIKRTFSQPTGKSSEHFKSALLCFVSITMNRFHGRIDLNRQRLYQKFPCYANYLKL